MQIPVQANCQPSVKNNFFFGRSLDSFGFGAEAAGAVLEPPVFIGPWKVIVPIDFLDNCAATLRSDFRDVLSRLKVEVRVLLLPGKTKRG